MLADPLSSTIERALTTYQSMVRRVGLGHGLDEHDVDEVFQEVRIRLWKSLGSAEKIEAAPASYVYRTAASAALDLIRRRRVRPTESFDVEHASNPGLAEPGPTPDAQLVNAELAAAVARAVESLAEARRPVVRMHLQGYALGEIAELLGWSQAKVRNLLYRGMDDLREALQRAGIGPGGRA